MATEKLYYLDQYQTEMDAVVRSCEAVKGGYAVVLDQTVFYPTGGGQPYDTGTLGDANILDVSDVDGEVVHLCDRPLSVGERVHGKIDWDRRFMLMQHHSGEQLVSGIVHSRFGYDNVGFHMGSEVITIDFSGELDYETLRDIEYAANEAIYANIPCHIFYPDRETLKTLSYRSKKEIEGQVRLVQFADVDLCACCGLHVAHSGEIGLIKLLSTTKFHNGSRVELLCGKKALQWLNTVADQNREISGLLSAKPNQTASYVRRQAEELNQAKLRCAQLENQLFSLKAQALAGQTDILLFEDSLSPDSTRRLCDAILHGCSGYCAVFSKKEGGYNYAIGTKDGDLRSFVKELNTALQGRGGGKPNFVQGSVSANEESIRTFFQR
ncbi:MAG: alanyl-tRNA editing protein [Oscillospiraceae bacterium]|nr:alanyl-tRNA editing protein [Oscillospiraceae bacterium]